MFKNSTSAVFVWHGNYAVLLRSDFPSQDDAVNWVQKNLNVRCTPFTLNGERATQWVSLPIGRADVASIIPQMLRQEFESRAKDGLINIAAIKIDKRYYTPYPVMSNLLPLLQKRRNYSDMGELNDVRR